MLFQTPQLAEFAALLGAPVTAVTAPTQDPNPPGSKVNFVALDAHKQGMVKLRELEKAFNVLNVSADDRIAIVKLLHASNVLKCELEID